MKQPSPDIGSQILEGRYAGGPGVPCAEAQADGVPCADLALDCAECERAAAAVLAAASSPALAPSSPIHRASGDAADHVRGRRRP